MHLFAPSMLCEQQLDCAACSKVPSHTIIFHMCWYAASIQLSTCHAIFVQLHQTSCQALYTKIKDLMPKGSSKQPSYCIIAAAVFGSKASQDIPGSSIICTPPDLADAGVCTITLQPTSHDIIIATAPPNNNIATVSVGLLLDPEEREQMWQAFLSAPNLQALKIRRQFQDPATKTQILTLSGGHVSDGWCSGCHWCKHTGLHQQLNWQSSGLSCSGSYAQTCHVFQKGGKCNVILEAEVPVCACSTA